MLTPLARKLIMISSAAGITLVIVIGIRMRIMANAYGWQPYLSDLAKDIRNL